MIPFSGEYTKAQWSRGIRLAMYPKGRALIFRLLGLALCLAVIGALVVSRLQGETVQASRVVRMLISAGVLGVWAALPYVRAWQAMAQPWRGGRSTPNLRGVVTEQGITSNATRTGAEEKWSTFLQAYLHDDIAVLIGSDGLATILPREFFAGEDDWRAFRQVVEFNVTPPR